jgi:hypothetical protein
MPTYKGNKGNLLQHWVLTELTLLLRHKFPASARLCLLDAHAMSPYAMRDPNPGPSARVFDIFRSYLPGQGSAYERAWLELLDQKLGGAVEYPTTAMFVRHLWPGQVSMVLCDIDKTTIDNIYIWKQNAQDSDSIVPYHGDWRRRFRGEFPNATATLVSFDPYMIVHKNVSAPKPGNMYLADLIQAAAALCHIPSGPVIVQLSTYSAQDNSQDDVLSVVEWIMRAAGFELVDTVRAGRDSRDMMSMILVRELPERPEGLNERFNDWFDRAKNWP